MRPYFGSLHTAPFLAQSLQCTASTRESSVPQDVIDRELSVGRELAIQEGKPEEMADKIAQGRLKKFYKETTLLNQMFVRDNKKTVKQFLADTNPDLTVTDFKRISLSI